MISVYATVQNKCPSPREISCSVLIKLTNGPLKMDLDSQKLKPKCMHFCQKRKLYNDLALTPEDDPVDWGCRIHRLYLCRGVRSPPLISALDMTQNNLLVMVIAIAPRYTLAQNNSI